MPIRFYVSFLLIALIGGSSIAAAEFDPTQVPADAKWVIHVDLQTAHDTQLGRALNKRLAEDENVQQQLKRVRQEIGLDPIRDILSVTAYNNEYVDHSGTVVIHIAELDQQRLLAALAEKHPNHQVSRHAAHKLYTWTMLKGRPAEHQVTGSLHGSIMILSRDAARVATALDLIEGIGTALPEDSPLSAETESGTVMVVRGIEMIGQNTPFRSGLIRRASSIAISAGQAKESVFLKAQMVAESIEAAKQCRSVIEGFRAMATLQADQDETAKRILRGLVVTSDERTVTAEWRIANDDIQAVLQKPAFRAGGAKIPARPTNNDSTQAPTTGAPTDPNAGSRT